MDYGVAAGDGTPTTTRTNGDLSGAPGDASLRWWGPDGPTGEHRLPVYVLTHRQSHPPPADGVPT
ncbi:hypothetical protein, partial [Nonomuraea aridisoli]